MEEIIFQWNEGYQGFVNGMVGIKKLNLIQKNRLKIT